MTDAERYARLNEVFELARHAPAAQRPERVRALAGGDSDLERQALELLELYDGKHAAPALLDEQRLVARGERVGALFDASNAADKTWMPEYIGAYRIVERIGEGGMGLVFAAEQETPRRRVALKLIHPLLASGERLQRFRREAELLGRLHHSGVAQIYEAGEFDVGRGSQPFFAMEYVDGVDLASYATREGLGVRERMELVAKVADAVQHAHDRGVIHRDLKPDNVLVRASGQPVVLDFGVARATDAAEMLSTLATQTGQLLGTLAYMAPEQLAGDSDRITGRADVYALGAIAYQLLSARPPHGVAGIPITQAIALISDSDARRLGLVDPRLRGDVETIVAKALAREPERRYESPAALAEDIRRWLEDRPIVARPPSRIYLMRKFARRNRALATGVVALALGVLIATALGLIALQQRGEALRSAQAADEARAETTTNLYHAQMLLASDAASDSGQFAGLRAFVEDWREPPDSIDPRGWEWKHFAAAAAERELVIPVATSPVVLAWRPGTNTITTNGVDGVEWIDASSGSARSVRAPNQELGHVGRLAWSPRGDRLALAWPERLGVYTVAEGERLEALWLANTDAEIRALAWRPDGAALASVDANRAVAVRSVESGTTLAAVVGEFARDPGALAYDPSSQRLAVADRSIAVWMLDADTLETLGALRPPMTENAAVTALAWRPDGTKLALCGWPGRLHVWDALLHEETNVVVAHDGGAMSIDWSPRGTQLLTAGNDKALRVWDAALVAATDTRRGHTGRVACARWSEDGRRIASCSADDGTVRIWSLDTWSATQRIPFQDRRPLQSSSPALAWDPRAERLYVHRVDNQHVLELVDGSFVVDPSVPHLPSFGPWSADGRLRAVVEDEELLVRDDARPEQVLLRVRPNFRVATTLWSPADPALLALCGVGGVRTLDVNGAGELRSVFELDAYVTSLAWRADGRRMCIPTHGALHVVDLAGVELRRFENADVRGSSRVAYSVDGGRIACALNSSRVAVLDAETLAIQMEVRGLTHDAGEIAWSPDGSRLAIASSDGAVKLAEARTGDLTASFDVGERVGAILWSRDGAHLIALSLGGELRRWSIE